MIELTGVTKQYGSTVAVWDLTFAVKPWAGFAVFT
jgi:ABC-type Na+ transport system ATPase subunit NatA